MDTMENTQLRRSTPTSIRKKTACAECRQQKMRCESVPSAPGPRICLRCRQLQIPCVFSAPFKRTHKRKRMQELEVEINALKRQLLSSQAAPRNPLPSGNAPSPEQTVDGPNIVTTKIIRHDNSFTDNNSTLSRAIDGLDLTSSIIEDCFDLYFKHYHAMLPILDPSIAPNTVYQHVPILFWVIVSIGSRRYDRQPTLTEALAQPVIRMALQSILVRSKPIERMKALILLLNWPFPVGPFFSDPSFLLGGTLLHMAMQCGLQAPSFSQDFSKSYLPLSEQELIRRTEMWAYVVITYQRTNSGSGQPSLLSFEIYNEQLQFKPLLEKLPTTLKTQTHISNIITRAHRTLLELGLFSMNLQQERAMDALLKGFNNELDSLENLGPSNWDRLYIAFARQDISNMHFYKSATNLDIQSCISIFNATSNVLGQIVDLDRTCGLHLICTRFIRANTLLSLASMARVLKGPFSGYLDLTQGHDLYDAGVRFLRSSSVRKGDFGERSAMFAERIWNSEKVFRDPDGSINITLRVRNRLSSSPLHDVARCWKEEFAELNLTGSAPGMDIEAVLPSSTATRLDATRTLDSITNVILPDFFGAPDIFTNDELWGDWGLGLSNESDVNGLSTT